jgi:uncharacterized protein (TIGR02217 family)
MAFFEERFPDSIAQGGRGGPRFSTSAQKTPGGFRGANQNWSAPLHFFNVDQAVKTEADFVTVRAFFYVVKGAFDGFRFKDYSNFTVTQAQGAMPLVTGSVYQMSKTESYGSRSWVRTIAKPVAGTAVIYRTRSSVTTDITSSCTIDTTNGHVTVTGHVSGDTYAWAGEFDVPVAFSRDDLEAEWLGPKGFLQLSWGSIDLEEIRLS